MTTDFFSWPDIRDLLARSLPQRQALRDLYARLPVTRCRRHTRCCSLLPETSLPEALAALAGLRQFPPDRCRNCLKRLVRYFLVNPLEITSCPFLEGADCLIYEDRFFGCRAYGLWSPEEYRRRAEAGRQAKKNLGEQWLRLGVRLPAAVIDFQVPYCRETEPTEENAVNDQGLIDVEEAIEEISEQIHPESGYFRDRYFSDPSFLVAGLFLGVPEALRLKFTLVREGLRTGNRQPLEEALRDLELTGDPLIPPFSSE
jgi:Fe-S-cluster containining protein